MILYDSPKKGPFFVDKGLSISLKEAEHSMDYITVSFSVDLASPTKSGTDGDPRQGLLYSDVAPAISTTAYDFVEGAPSTNYIVPSTAV
jgi:hypothetical protein